MQLRVWSWRRSLAWLTLAVATVGCQSASTLGYLAHVTAGQARILLGQQPLESLDRSTLLPAERANLDLLDDVRSFSRTVGLDVEGQFTRYYPSDVSWAVWVLTASPSTAPVLHTWDFPIAGRVPYLGFFSRAVADRYRDAYRQQGFHTALRSASAYSTLGWFDDPLFRAQLDVSRPGFASTVFHELVHATAYQAGASDWNESVASFTETKLLELYQHERHVFEPQELSRQAALEADWVLLRSAIGEIRDDLVGLYTQSPARYAHEVTDHVNAWRATLTDRPWQVMRGVQLAGRPWPVPALLGMKLYATDTTRMEAAWQRSSAGTNSVATMQRWLAELQRCAEAELGFGCFEAAAP